MAKTKGRQCNHINRVNVHPSVVIGGASIGQCPNEALEGFVVCYEHVEKAALLLMIDNLRRDLRKARRELNERPPRTA